ncbi:MAG TPA: hypothetical protein DCG52_01810 [Alphaproteobacteria bacterium]|nr:hypothetical protein [Alphaproteobacteria bacterium]
MSTYRKFIEGEIDSERHVDYKGLSICCINDFYGLISGKIKYQVHCDDNKYKFSKLYTNLDIAINKFMAIRRNLMNYKGASH